MTILNTAISGLLASQRSLATTSHNIANVNTEGYSRQRVDLVAREPQFRGVGYIGNGVEAASIRRITDQFLTKQMQTSASSSNDVNSFLTLANRVDDMLANEDTGLSPSLQNFFSSIQDVNDLPSSATTRQIMLSEAESLAERFKFLDSRLSDLGSEVKIQLENDINDINTLAQSIADINQRIVVATGIAQGQPPNDLLDQRDVLIQDLSELVSVNTIELSDASMSVFIGKGQALVINDQASTLGISETYEGHFEVTLVDPFVTNIITDSITGGGLGGRLNFQTEMLEPARNALGRLAIGLADSFNAQHRLGISQDGDVNTPFFAVAAPSVISLGTAPNNISSVITDPVALTDSDYNLVYNGADSFVLTRLSDNTTTTINTGGAYPFTSVAIDGFTVSISAAPTAGDQYIIRPTINGADDIDVLISDTRKIAIAGPLKGSEVTNASGIPTNTGTSEISDVNITTTTGLLLPADITLTYNPLNNGYDISTGGTLLYDPATENAGKQFTLTTAAGDATLTISGFPNTGDAFVIQNNLGADGDNRNGLLLAKLQTDKLLLNGSASLQESYGQLVADIGTTTRQAEISSEALGVLLEQTIAAKESVSGVNLDEEAADILKFQQAYTAAAQMITVADQIFQDLINAVR
jgi:flagellar hook-associated protein 1